VISAAERGGRNDGVLKLHALWSFREILDALDQSFGALVPLFMEMPIAGEREYLLDVRAQLSARLADAAPYGAQHELLKLVHAFWLQIAHGDFLSRRTRHSHA
jgi:hypothetical protein